MSNVKICDRCGEHLVKKCFISLKPVRYILSRETTKRCVWTTVNYVRDYDLCENCAAELDEFLKSKVKEEINDGYSTV